jgi:hypothetical protein
MYPGVKPPMILLFPKRFRPCGPPATLACGRPGHLISIGIQQCVNAFLFTTKPFLKDRNNHDQRRDSMKLAYVLLALAFLVPLAFSAPANDGDMHFAGEAIDVSHPSSDYTSNAVSQASERVFVGSMKSSKYHYPSCQWAKKIKTENEIWFSSSQDAQNQGYVACKVCNPP